MYYLTFNKKRHAVSALTFWSACTVIGSLLICAVAAILYCLFFTMGYYAIFALVALIDVNVTTNGKKKVYALIKNSALRKFLSATIVVGCVAYTAYYHLVG